MAESKSWVPVPDPTLLTTEAIRNDIEALRELLESEIKASNQNIASMRELMESKLDAWARTTQEKFVAIGTQFSERDTRAIQVAQEIKTAMDKSDAAVTKQIDSMQLLIASSKHDLDGKIIDVKDRVTVIESVNRGERIVSTDKRADNNVIIQIIIAILAGVAILVSTGTVLLQSHQAAPTVVRHGNEPS